MKPPKMLINAQALVSIRSVNVGNRTVTVSLKDEEGHGVLAFVFKKPEGTGEAEFIGEAHSQVALEDLLQKAGEEL